MPHSGSNFGCQWCLLVAVYLLAILREFYLKMLRQVFSCNADFIYFILRVGRQVVNIPSFMVRVDSQKHIDFSLTSPFGGGRPGRVKRKNQKAASKKASGGDGDEEDEE